MPQQSHAEDIIFLSSQPDEFYFLWQLELQLFNFISVGIAPRQIHILIGYDSRKGLLADYQQFIARHKEVNIHAYPDTRKSKLYAPSLRWHIIAKHFEAFPSLQQASIFHHDSDIVFKSLPDFDLLTQDDTWYVSDTTSYLNTEYICRTAGDKVFQRMCKIIGITPTQVKDEDANAGGAQYLLKKVDIPFLKKMEKDAERMFRLLTAVNRKRQGICDDAGHHPLIQAWTADMWVIWWNALYCNRKFQIHQELDFVWTDNKMAMFDRCKILHYTGFVNKRNPRIFRKGDYINYPPFYADLREIDADFCGGFMKVVIEEYLCEERAKNTDLMDVSFIIDITSLNEDTLANAHTVTGYLTNNFKTNIILRVKEVDAIDPSKLPGGTKVLDVNTCISDIIALANTPYIAIHDANMIVPQEQLLAAICLLRQHETEIVRPYNSTIYKVDRLFKAMFNKLQDIQLLEENQNKFYPVEDAGDGIILLNRKQCLTLYAGAGWCSHQNVMLNEKINSSILFHCVSGAAYRLPDEVYEDTALLHLTDH